MELGLTGHVAVITGGASGIGCAIAEAMAAEGASVAVVDRDVEAALRTAAAITARGGPRAAGFQADVGSEEAVRLAFDAITARFGRLDVLVNAAGVLSTGAVDGLPVSEWNRVANVNVAGVLACSKAALPAMAGQRRGRIVNIASVSAFRGGGSVGNALYGASKAAVVALTLGLAREWGPHGITVNAIAPAVADTPMTSASLTPEARARILTRIPLGRFAAVSDVADLTVFLASQRAAFISGAVIPVDGALLTT